MHFHKTWWRQCHWLMRNLDSKTRLEFFAAVPILILWSLWLTSMCKSCIKIPWLWLCACSLIVCFHLFAEWLVGVGPSVPSTCDILPPSLIHHLAIPSSHLPYSSSPIGFVVRHTRVHLRADHSFLFPDEHALCCCHGTQFSSPPKQCPPQVAPVSSRSIVSVRSSSLWSNVSIDPAGFDLPTPQWRSKRWMRCAHSWRSCIKRTHTSVSSVSHW